MNPDKSDIDRFFKRVDKIHGVTGIMFVGKEVLGYTADTQIRADLLKYTADKLKERHLPFYMIEAANQLQYDQQEGMYSLADAVDYDTVRVYAMSKDELDKLDVIWSATVVLIFIPYINELYAAPIGRREPLLM